MGNTRLFLICHQRAGLKGGVNGPISLGSWYWMSLEIRFNTVQYDFTFERSIWLRFSLSSISMQLPEQRTYFFRATRRLSQYCWLRASSEGSRSRRERKVYSLNISCRNEVIWHGHGNRSIGILVFLRYARKKAYPRVTVFAIGCRGGRSKGGKTPT